MRGLQDGAYPTNFILVISIVSLLSDLSFLPLPLFFLVIPVTFFFFSGGEYNFKFLWGLYI